MSVRVAIRRAIPYVLVVVVGWSSTLSTEAQDASPLGSEESAAPEEVSETEAPEPLSEERASTDERIRSHLQSVFDRIESLTAVSVTVEAGIVRLRGTALDLESRQRAVDLAKGTDGVVFVDDEISVVTDLRERLDPAFDRIREYAVDAVAFLPLLAVALLLFVLMAGFGWWISQWNGPHLKVSKSPFIRGLLRQLVRFGFFVGGLLIALELLDATALVGAVLGTAGVFGLALGFAFKDIVENHLAGIMLSLRQPFAPNDHITVGGHEGKVVRLTARETILMTLSGNHVRIPNAELYRSVLTNYTQNPRRRFDFVVSVGTSDDLLHAQQVGLDVQQRMVGVLDDPKPSAQIVELGDSSVTLRFFGWVNQSSADFGRVRSEAIRLTKVAFEEAGISMPSPEYVVDLKGQPDRVSDETRGVESTVSRGSAGSRTAGGSDVQQDVSVDRSLDEQIEADRRTSEEDDLLVEDSDPNGEASLGT